MQDPKDLFLHPTSELGKDLFSTSVAELRRKVRSGKYYVKSLPVMLTLLLAGLANTPLYIYLIMQKQSTCTNDLSYITCISLTLALQAQEHSAALLQHLQAEQREEERRVAAAGAEQERRIGEQEICRSWQEKEKKEEQEESKED